MAVSCVAARFDAAGGASDAPPASLRRRTTPCRFRFEDASSRHIMPAFPDPHFPKVRMGLPGWRRTPLSVCRSDTTRAVPLAARRSRPLDGGPSFSFGNRAYRALWAVAWFALASWTPPFLHGWRLFVLRLFGARVAPGARVYSSARIWDPRHLALDAYACIGPRVDCYAMAPISLGRYAIVSQDAVLCGGTHDVDDPGFQLTTKPIVIGERAWVAAGPSSARACRSARGRCWERARSRSQISRRGQSMWEIRRDE